MQRTTNHRAESLFFIALLLGVMFVASACSTLVAVKENATPAVKYTAVKNDYLTLVETAELFTTKCLARITERREAAAVSGEPVDLPSCRGRLPIIKTTLVTGSSLLQSGDAIYESGEWEKLTSYVPMLEDVIDTLVLLTVEKGAEP